MSVSLFFRLAHCDLGAAGSDIPCWNLAREFQVAHDLHNSQSNLVDLMSSVTCLPAYVELDLADLILALRARS